MSKCYLSETERERSFRQLFRLEIPINKNNDDDDKEFEYICIYIHTHIYMERDIRACLRVLGAHDDESDGFGGHLGDHGGILIPMK
jgi:hypothetical protein